MYNKNSERKQYTLGMNRKRPKLDSHVHKSSDFNLSYRFDWSGLSCAANQIFSSCVNLHEEDRRKRQGHLALKHLYIKKREQTHISPLITCLFNGSHHLFCFKRMPFLALRNKVSKWTHKIGLSQLDTRLLFIFGKCKNVNLFLSLIFSADISAGGWSYVYSAKNKSAGTQDKIGILQWLWVRGRKLTKVLLLEFHWASNLK